MILCTPCIEHPLESPVVDLNHFEIIRKACEYLNLKESDVLSKCRRSEFVIARMIIVNLLLNQKSFYYSLTRIAEIMGKRDHSTIVYNRDEFRNWVTTDEAMQTLLKNTHLHVFNSLRYYNF